MTDRFLSPQQELYLERYTNPKSPTFANSYRSALEAGYSESYADNLHHLLPEWLEESLGDFKRLKRAEKNLDEVQNLNILNEDGKPDSQLIEKRTKVDMFILERLNKQKYSSRTELTGKDGKDLPVPIMQINRDALLENNSDTEDSESN